MINWAEPGNWNDGGGSDDVFRGIAEVDENAPSTTTVSVPADQPWTDTGINVAVGSSVSITAEGTINIAYSDPGKTPDGDQNYMPADIPQFTWVAPDAHCWSLIGRIGDGAPFEVSSSKTLLAATSGRLYLGVNDGIDTFGDNSGAWFAHIIVRTDSTPPVTAPSAKTADGNTYNSGEWTNKDVTLTLAASDEGGSSVDKIFYNTDGSANYQEYTAPLSLTSEGTTTVYYYATDKAGNEETPQTFAVKIDKSAPTTTATLSAQPNTNGWHRQNVTITLRATDQDALSGIREITYSATGAQPGTETRGPGSSAQLTITTEGQTTITYFATDQAGNAEQAKTLTIKMNKSAPRVVSVTPADGTAGVARGTNVTATFSEDMLASSINTPATTFKLFKKGSTTKLSATVSYNPTTRTATLDPFGSSTTLLARGTTYKAVVSTGAKDEAGTALDQKPSVAGSQQMVWYFTIRT